MATSNSGAPPEKTYFEQQRELLINDVAAVWAPSPLGRKEQMLMMNQSLENVLQNINKLNRSLEGVIAVGNEFSQVEGLWSQFENVMAKKTEEEDAKDSKEGALEEQAQS